MSYVNIINSYRYVVAICDEDLLGMKFEEGIRILDIKESFYKSEKTYSEKETVEIIQDMVREDATFNIAGEKSINAAIKSGLIQEEDISFIQEIPYVLVLL